MAFRTAALLLALCATPLAAQAPVRDVIDQGKAAVAERAGGLDLSAFADWGTWYDEAGHRRFGFGAAELDLGLRIGERFEVLGAYVGTPETRLWSVYLLDWHPFGASSVAPRGKLGNTEGLHLQVGRFDLPFGLDWAHFASKDSVSVSRPLTTQQVMDGGLNARGLRLLRNDGTWNVQVYALQGQDGGRGSGGRVGFTPFGMPYALKEGRDPKALELGLSALHEGASRQAFALDLEANLGAFTLVAEYLARRHRQAEGTALWHRGWHLTPQWSLGSGATTLFIRVEKVWGASAASPEPSGSRRVSLGLTSTLGGTLQAKAECQRSSGALAEDPASRGSRLLFQLVVVL